MNLAEVKKEEKLCDYPGCTAKAEFRAPKSREYVNQYYWFCLNHVREYNKKWNYYEGLDSGEIEEHLRFDQTWRRPTWPLGGKGRDELKLRKKVHDFFFKDTVREKSEKFEKKFMHADMSFAEKKAFEYLDVSPELAMSVIKKKYRDLVKKHHPDKHGGKEDKVEMLKKINLAFAIVEAYYNKKHKEADD